MHPSICFSACPGAGAEPSWHRSEAAFTQSITEMTQRQKNLRNWWYLLTQKCGSQHVNSCLVTHKHNERNTVLLFITLFLSCRRECQWNQVQGLTPTNMEEHRVWPLTSTPEEFYRLTAASEHWMHVCMCVFAEERLDAWPHSEFREVVWSAAVVRAVNTQMYTQDQTFII